MNSIDISVIIPAYNCANSIKRCIDSVLKQTDINVETIVIDDGSTDETLRICEDISKTTSTVKVIHQENNGISSARNAGLDIAKGKYISFLDSDDIIAPNGLEAMLTAITTNNVDAVIGEYQSIYEDGTVLQRGTIPENISGKIIDSKEYWILNSKKETNFLFTVVWGKLFKKEIWESLRFDDGARFAEDEYILPELVSRCNSFYLLNKPVYTQYMALGSLSRSAFSFTKLNSPESKLLTCDHLISKKLYSCAVEKWGIAVGEILLMTKLAKDSSTRVKINTLHKKICKLGFILFKHMDVNKKIKFIGYFIGYPFYSFIKAFGKEKS